MNASAVNAARPAINRVFVIVLDSAGVGFLPDAGEYGDNGGDLGANTLGHIGDAVGLTVPVMESLGLGRITPIRGVAPVAAPRGARDRLRGPWCQTRVADRPAAADPWAWAAAGARCAQTAACPIALPARESGG